jgi:RNA polymerase sigma factor (sigma-70 family)
MDQVADLTADPTDAPPGAPGFEDFFEQRRRPLALALWLVVRNRAETEEIAQDAFLKVWEHWDRVKQMDDPEGYLFRTAMNLQRNRRRRAALALRRTFRPQEGRDELAHIEQRDEVVRALGKLTRSQREALVVTDLLDYNSEEAGLLLGISPSTVRVQVARARAALKEQMGAQDE